MFTFEDKRKEKDVRKGNVERRSQLLLLPLPPVKRQTRGNQGRKGWYGEGAGECTCPFSPEGLVEGVETLTGQYTLPKREEVPERVLGR